MDVPVESLPRLIRVEPDRLVCLRCTRAWRKPATDMLSLANFNYLCEHVRGHEWKHRTTGYPKVKLPFIGGYDDVG